MLHHIDALVGSWKHLFQRQGQPSFRDWRPTPAMEKRGKERKRGSKMNNQSTSNWAVNSASTAAAMSVLDDYHRMQSGSIKSE